MAISLPLAILAACLMIGVSEYGYKQTSELLTNLTRAYDIRTSISVLMKDMLNAETGLRGYLLTNDPKYLEPYQEASKDISRSLENIRKNIENDPSKSDVFSGIGPEHCEKNCGNGFKPEAVSRRQCRCAEVCHVHRHGQQAT
jgi:Predicted periplasmic ligand-binding sensor domain